MKKYLPGFTLVELMVTVLLASIVMLALGSVLADAHRGFNNMYERANSPVVVDAYVARLAFDSVIRPASTGITSQPVITDTSVKVYLYSDPNQITPDRYAMFYVSGGTLFLEKGVRSSGSVLSTQTIAENVIDVDFAVKQACIQMMLELDNGKESLIVTISSIRHNP